MTRKAIACKHVRGDEEPGRARRRACRGVAAVVARCAAAAILAGPVAPRTLVRPRGTPARAIRRGAPGWCARGTPSRARRASRRAKRSSKRSSWTVDDTDAALWGLPPTPREARRSHLWPPERVERSARGGATRRGAPERAAASCISRRRAEDDPGAPGVWMPMASPEVPVDVGFVVVDTCTCEPRSFVEPIFDFFNRGSRLARRCRTFAESELRSVNEARTVNEADPHSTSRASRDPLARFRLNFSPRPPSSKRQRR